MQRLPLRKFRLQNFKAVRDSGSIAFGPLTVLIGNNGSGKSSLVEGLETFRDVVLDGVDRAMNRWRAFEYAWNRAAKHELLPAPNNGRPHLSEPMTFEVEMKTGPFGLRALQAITCDPEGVRLFIQEERALWSGRGQNLKRQTRDSEGRMTHTTWHSDSPEVDELLIDDGWSILRDRAAAAFLGWQFLALAPDAMGQPTPQQRAAGRIRLAKNGANIAEYLNEIRELDETAFRGIVEALQFVMPFTQDLEPKLASELQREFYLNLKEEQFEVPGWLLSTGTLRILALLACLRHPEPPPLLVVEEVENGLDPRTLNLLVEEIRAAIDTGKTQVILTTHSPYLLDLLDLSHIVVVERVNGEPTFTRPDKAALAQWAKSFSPGHLYTMGRLTKQDE